MKNDETLLWETEDEDGLSCVMVSCCSGAELQLRKGGGIVLRELYPDKSTVYERAHQLKTEAAFRSSPGAAVPARTPG